MEALIVLTIILACALVLLAVLNAWLAVVYVIEGKALQMIAKRRGFSAPWMAWIPFANAWLFGSISDQYQQKVNGRICKRGKTLLAMKIAIQAYSNVASILAGVATGIVMILRMPTGGSVEDLLLILLVAVGIELLPMLVITTVYDVVVYIVCYDLYVSSKPKQAILFLILSILTPATPFLIYACRKSDGGLPPKKQEE
jgi:hypothetical protein